MALALAALASAALFPPLVRGWFGDERARWGAIWFGAATATLLFTSRLPFAIGVAFGLAALLALQRRHYWLAILFAVLCPLGSPVAGLFLAMAGVAYAIAERHDRPKRSEGLAIAAAAFFPPVFMSWAFPEGGWAPFPTSAYIPIPVFALACLIVLPREQSALRWGAVLYGLGSTLALALETPMGGNAVRLGALFGGPVLLCALWGRPWTKRVWVLPLLTAGFAALAFWQWSPAVRDVIKYLEDPAAKSDYFTPAEGVPLQAARPAPHRDPLHALALGGLRGGDGPGAGARLVASAGYEVEPDLLSRGFEPAHVCELAGG